MGPEKAARLAASHLMITYKNTSPYVPGETPTGQGWRVSSSGQKYSSNQIAERAIIHSARRLIPFIDYYPLEQCQERLKDFVIEEMDKSTPLPDVSRNVNTHIVRFLQSFKSQSTWEVVYAVRGVSLASGTFSLGDCRFIQMDDTQFLLWGRRSATGLYDPPSNTPIPRDWFTDEADMKDQIVAAVRVEAVDHHHASIKSKKRIEETIDLLRYGQLAVGYPSRPFPEIGVWLRQWQHDHNFLIQIDAPSFVTNKTLANPEGCDYSICKQTPAWTELENIIHLELANRSELELRLMTALKWIGQAAVAPADTIRLVALVTALEALLIQESESLGKRSKLTSRISVLAGTSEEECRTFARYVDELYRVRSGCVHAGLLDIEKDEVAKCIYVVRRTIEAILTRSPFSSMKELSQIVAHIESSGSGSEEPRRQCVAENAYFRWLDEVRWVESGCPPDRQLQHWIDAEREFLFNRASKDKFLDDLPSGDSSTC